MTIPNNVPLNYGVPDISLSNGIQGLSETAAELLHLADHLVYRSPELDSRQAQHALRRRLPPRSPRLSRRLKRHRRFCLHWAVYRGCRAGSRHRLVHRRLSARLAAVHHPQLLAEAKSYLRDNVVDAFAMDDWRDAALVHAELRRALGVLRALHRKIRAPGRRGHQSRRRIHQRDRADRRDERACPPRSSFRGTRPSSRAWAWPGACRRSNRPSCAPASEPTTPSASTQALPPPWRISRPSPTSRPTRKLSGNTASSACARQADDLLHAGQRISCARRGGQLRARSALWPALRDGVEPRHPEDTALGHRDERRLQRCAIQPSRRQAGAARRCPDQPAATDSRSEPVLFNYDEAAAYLQNERRNGAREQAPVHGVSLGANYQYGHAIDDATSVNGSSGSVVQNWQDWLREEGHSVLDIRHQVSGTYLFELPFGPGQSLGHLGRRLSHSRRLLGFRQFQLRHGCLALARVRADSAERGVRQYQRLAAES